MKSVTQIPPLWNSRSLDSSPKKRQEPNYANISPELARLARRVDETCREIQEASNPNSNICSSRTSSDLSRPGFIQRNNYFRTNSKSVSPATAFIDFLKKQDEQHVDLNARNRENVSSGSSLLDRRQRSNRMTTSSSSVQPSSSLPSKPLIGYSSFPPSLGELPHKVRIACLEQDVAGEKIERQRLEAQLSKALQDVQLEKMKAREFERETKLRMKKQAETVISAREEMARQKGIIKEEHERTKQSDQRNARTQELVQSLEGELKRLRDELAAKEQTVREQGLAYQARSQDRDRLLATNRLLTKQLQNESTLRQEELSNHEDVRAAMRRRWETGNRELTKEKEKTLEKSKTIDEWKERYEKLNARYLQLAKRSPIQLEIEVQNMEKALAHSEQKAKHMMNKYTEQLSQIQQKEEDLSKARVELTRLQGKLTVVEEDLLRYRQGDVARNRVEEIARKEAARLRTELETEKTLRELERKKAKEEALEQKDAQRISIKAQREAEHALHMKLVQAEKNVEFYRAQSIIHENKEKSLQQDMTQLHKSVSNELDELRSRNRKLEEKKKKLEGMIADQLEESGKVDKRMMQLQVFEQRSKELEKMVETRDRQLSKQALRLIKMDEMGIASRVAPVEEVDIDSEEEQEQQQTEEEAAANAAISKPCMRGHITEKEVVFLKEVQHNLEGIAELVVCCVNGTTPKSELLDATETIANEENSEELLTKEDCSNFCDSVNNLRLDVRRLRSYITKKYASELTEQCYVQ